MKGRENRAPPPSADLLVCFPSRTHLSLLRSPARLPETTKRHHNHHLIKPTTSAAAVASDLSEPTSPRVTCAGQIKVRPRQSSCKNWQSVMEEIERLHNNRSKLKNGIKKDIMQFMTCLGRMKFDFRCFRSYPTTELTYDDEEEDEDEDEDHGENQVGFSGIDGNGSSRTVFSKWFVALQDQQSSMFTIEERENRGERKEEEPVVAPENALLLMRSRSAPAKSWLEEREEEDDDEEDNGEKAEEEEEEEEEEIAKLDMSDMEDDEKRRESLEMVMRYDSDFYKLSCDIAKETWVVGGLRDSISRSQSWKR